MINVMNSLLEYIILCNASVTCRQIKSQFRSFGKTQIGAQRPPAGQAGTRSVGRRKEILTKLRSISDEYLGGVIQDAIDRKELDPGLNLSQSVFFLDSVLNRFLKDYHEAMGSEDRGHFNRNEWVKGITQFFSKGLGT
ncbi:MAG: hypothetical protein IIA61_02670 [Candidatus Marinimicrobia bacterium]|nr:hypothetical protein [Candidatus Neomarinimicrobiota bacterium]